MSKVRSSISIEWNTRNLVDAVLTLSYKVCNQNIHLARYVQDLYGVLNRLRSQNIYNIYYRMVGKEFCRVNQGQMAGLFNLFMDSADFDTIKGKWSDLVGFTFRANFTEPEYRQFIYSFRAMIFGNSTPAELQLALQQMLQLDSNKVKILEYFKDSAIMTFFTNDWAIRNNAQLIHAGTTDGSNVTNSPNKLGDSTFLASATPNQYIGMKIVITSGAGQSQVATVVGNDTSFFTLDTNWTTVPNTGDGYVLSIFHSMRDDLRSLRPNLVDYTNFGLSNYGFQVWVSVDNYLGVLGFISDYLRIVKLDYIKYSIAYILHRHFAGSLTAALLNPATNPTYVAIGTGNPAWDPYNPQPTGTETSLYAESARRVALVNYIDSNENPTLTPTQFLEANGFFETGVSTSPRVMEVGLYAEDGTTLLAYQAFSAIKKNADEAFIWKWRLNYDSL